MFVLFAIFLDSYEQETKIGTETIVANIYELIRKKLTTNVKQVAILCGFTWMKFNALETTEKVTALTELSA